MTVRIVTSRLAFALLLCSAVLLFARPAHAWSYHSFAYGYSVSLPDDWAQVPEEVFAAKMADLPTAGPAGGRLDVAFQPKRNGEWLDRPYMIVQVVPYSGMGIPSQVNDEQILQIVKTNTGMDPSNPFRAEGQVVEGGGESALPEGMLSMDKENRRYIWDSSVSQQGIGVLRRTQWGFFGKESLVQVTLYESGRGSDRLRDLAQAVAGSFKFELGRDYQQALTFSDMARAAGDMFAKPNKGMIVTMSCVVVAIAFAIYSIASSHKRELAYRQYSPFDDR